MSNFYNDVIVKNRVGKFQISHELIEHAMQLLLQCVFNRVFITHVKKDELVNTYYGFSDLFEINSQKLDEENYPEYQFTFEKLEGTCILKECKKVIDYWDGP